MPVRLEPGRWCRVEGLVEGLGRPLLGELSTQPPGFKGLGFGGGGAGGALFS